MRPLQAHCHHGLGTLYAKLGRQEPARAELDAAIESYRAMVMTFWLPQAEAALAEVDGRRSRMATFWSMIDQIAPGCSDPVTGPTPRRVSYRSSDKFVLTQGTKWPRGESLSYSCPCNDYHVLWIWRRKMPQWAIDPGASAVWLAGLPIHHQETVPPVPGTGMTHYRKMAPATPAAAARSSPGEVPGRRH
jgi:hypothetical protein